MAVLAHYQKDCSEELEKQFGIKIDKRHIQVSLHLSQQVY